MRDWHKQLLSYNTTALLYLVLARNRQQTYPYISINTFLCHSRTVKAVTDISNFKYTEREDNRKPPPLENLEKALTVDV